MTNSFALLCDWVDLLRECVDTVLNVSPPFWCLSGILGEKSSVRGLIGVKPLKV